MHEEISYCILNRIEDIRLTKGLWSFTMVSMTAATAKVREWSERFRQQPTAILIPEGATVQVTSGPLADSRMLDVLWERRTLAVFAEDLFQRGKKVKSVRAPARREISEYDHRKINGCQNATRSRG